MKGVLPRITDANVIAQALSFVGQDDPVCIPGSLNVATETREVFGLAAAD